MVARPASNARTRAPSSVRSIASLFAMAGIAMVFEHLFPVGDQHRAASPSTPPYAKSDEYHTPEDRDHSEIAVRGWKDILLRLFKDISKHRILALAAGMTYYSILALFPAIAALVAVYGLFSDPSTITRHLDQLGGFLPGGALEVA
jgi:membrane protein